MRTDPRFVGPHRIFPTVGASTQADYDEPIYDLGHLTPSADQTSSVTAVVNSFVLTNMTPQTCPFNEGIWQIFEGITRQWADSNGSTYLINGSVFDWNNDGSRDPDSTVPRMRANNHTDRVAVPSHFYKIVTLERPGGTLETISIMMPNDLTMLTGASALAYLQHHITTIAAIEHVTGLRFFPSARVRPVEATTLWPLTAAIPRNLCQRANRPARFP